MVVAQRASIPDRGEPTGQSAEQIAQGSGLLLRSSPSGGRKLVLFHESGRSDVLHCSDSFVRQHGVPLGRVAPSVL